MDHVEDAEASRVDSKDSGADPQRVELTEEDVRLQLVSASSAKSNRIREFEGRPTR